MNIGDKVRMIDTRGHVPNGAEGEVIGYTDWPEFDIRVDFGAYGRARVSSNRVEKIVDIKVGDIVEIVSRTEQDDDWVEPGVKALVTGIVFGSTWPVNVESLDDPDEGDALKMNQLKKVGSRRPTVGDKVRVVDPNEPHYGETGTVIEDDHDNQPWNVKFEDGGTWWYYKDGVVLVEAATEKPLTKADLPVGTKVRIVSQGKHGTSLGVGTEGTIVEPFDAGHDAVWVHNPDHNFRGHGIRYAVSELEIIEDAEPKVGDPVTRELADALPIGAEIAPVGSLPRRKTSSGWILIGADGTPVDLTPLQYRQLVPGYKVTKIAGPEILKRTVTIEHALEPSTGTVVSPVEAPDRQYTSKGKDQWKSSVTGIVLTWRELLQDWPEGLTVVSVAPEQTEADKAREYFRANPEMLDQVWVSDHLRSAFALAREAMAAE